MTLDHVSWRDSAGAYVLGALEADERSAFEEHLRSCDRCAAEVVELAPLPALLGRVSPDELDQDSGSGLLDIVAAVQAGVDRIERSRHRWMAIAAAAVLLLVAGVAARTVWNGGGDDVELADRGVPLAVSAPAGVDGEVVADPRSWGTYVHLAVEGLPTRERYEVWVVDRTGDWHHAGSWGSNDARDARLGVSSHVAIEEIEQVVVTSADPNDQLLSARPSSETAPSSDQSSRE